MRRRSWLIGSALLALLAGCGEETSNADAGPMLVPFDVDTVGPMQVRAGQPIMVTCLLVDEMGETFVPPPDLESSLRFVPASSVELDGTGNWIATTAGTLEVACTFESLRMTDATPAVIEVVPGDPALVRTVLERDSLEAGEDVRVTCDVFDAYGNRIEEPVEDYRSEPDDPGNTFVGSLGTFERAGRFDVFCDLPGAETQPAELEVRPGLPASLVISRVPTQPIYAIGQVIDIQRIVTDPFDNPVEDAVVPVNSVAPGQRLGDGRFRYLVDGIYELTATVEPPTFMDIPLTAMATVIVDGNGPAINCDDPLDGAILDRAPGGTLTFRGSVADLSGVDEVRINGTLVPIDPSGEFSTTLTTQWGINFIDLSATDGTGRESSRTCAFLVSDVWAPDSSIMDDMLSLRLRQEAWDDSNRVDGLDSLADVLYTVLNSTGLRNELHSTLLMSNPLKPNACDSSVLGICVLRSRVDYLDMSVPGPNTVSMDLVTGGVATSVRIEDLAVRIRVRGHVAGISYDTTGWVTFDNVDVDVTFNTAISGGRPRITVRPGSVSTRVGGISTNFSGLSGLIIDIIVGLFNGVVRNLVSGLVTDYVTDNFNDILDGVVGGLDISTFGTSFTVPRLDSTQTIPLSFSIGFTDPLSTTSSRMLFGIGTRFSAPPAHARPTLGAPVKAGARRLDIGGTGTAGVSVHESILNQAVHALWRGGFFDATINADTLGGGLPAGLEADLFTGLTPVAQIVGGRTELSMGAVALRLTYPAISSDPILMTLGVRSSMESQLLGDDLVFDDFRIEELYFSTDAVSLDMATRDTIEGFLRRLLERVLGSALNDALPAIPIPTFELPSSLAVFGLPAGAELGIVSPALGHEPPHYVLRGDFAVR